MHIILSRRRAVVIFLWGGGIVEGSARFVIASLRAAGGKAASREKNIHITTARSLNFVETWCMLVV